MNKSQGSLHQSGWAMTASTPGQGHLGTGVHTLGNRGALNAAEGEQLVESSLQARQVVLATPNHVLMSKQKFRSSMSMHMVRPAGLSKKQSEDHEATPKPVATVHSRSLSSLKRSERETVSLNATTLNLERNPTFNNNQNVARVTDNATTVAAPTAEKNSAMVADVDPPSFRNLIQDAFVQEKPLLSSQEGNNNAQLLLNDDQPIVTTQKVLMSKDQIDLLSQKRQPSYQGPQPLQTSQDVAQGPIQQASRGDHHLDQLVPRTLKTATDPAKTKNVASNAKVGGRLVAQGPPEKVPNSDLEQVVVCEVEQSHDETTGVLLSQVPKLNIDSQIHTSTAAAREELLETKGRNQLVDMANTLASELKVHRIETVLLERSPTRGDCTELDSPPLGLKAIRGLAGGLPLSQERESTLTCGSKTPRGAIISPSFLHARKVGDSNSVFDDKNGHSARMIDSLVVDGARTSSTLKDLREVRTPSLVALKTVSSNNKLPQAGGAQVRTSLQETESIQSNFVLTAANTSQQPVHGLVGGRGGAQAGFVHWSSSIPSHTKNSVQFQVQPRQNYLMTPEHPVFLNQIARLQHSQKKVFSQCKRQASREAQKTAKNVYVQQYQAKTKGQTHSNQQQPARDLTSSRNPLDQYLEGNKEASTLSATIWVENPSVSQIDPAIIEPAAQVDVRRCTTSFQIKREQQRGSLQKSHRSMRSSFAGTITASQEAPLHGKRQDSMHATDELSKGHTTVATRASTRKLPYHYNNPANVHLKRKLSSTFKTSHSTTTATGGGTVVKRRGFLEIQGAQAGQPVTGQQVSAQRVSRDQQNQPQVGKSKESKKRKGRQSFHHPIGQSSREETLRLIKSVSKSAVLSDKSESERLLKSSLEILIRECNQINTRQNKLPSSPHSTGKGRIVSGNPTQTLLEAQQHQANFSPKEAQHKPSRFKPLIQARIPTIQSDAGQAEDAGQVERDQSDYLITFTEVEGRQLNEPISATTIEQERPTMTFEGRPTGSNPSNKYETVKLQQQRSSCQSRQALDEATRRGSEVNTVPAPLSQVQISINKKSSNPQFQVPVSTTFPIQETQKDLYDSLESQQALQNEVEINNLDGAVPDLIGQGYAPANVFEMWAKDADLDQAAIAVIKGQMGRKMSGTNKGVGRTPKLKGGKARPQSQIYSRRRPGEVKQRIYDLFSQTHKTQMSSRLVTPFLSSYREQEEYTCAVPAQQENYRVLSGSSPLVRQDLTSIPPSRQSAKYDGYSLPEASYLNSERPATSFCKTSTGVANYQVRTETVQREPFDSLGQAEKQLSSFAQTAQKRRNLVHSRARASPKTFVDGVAMTPLLLSQISKDLQFKQVFRGIPLTKKIKSRRTNTSFTLTHKGHFSFAAPSEIQYELRKKAGPFQASQLPTQSRQKSLRNSTSSPLKAAGATNDYNMVMHVPSKQVIKASNRKISTNSLMGDSPSRVQVVADYLIKPSEDGLSVNPASHGPTNLISIGSAATPFVNLTQNLQEQTFPHQNHPSMIASTLMRNHSVNSQDSRSTTPRVFQLSQASSANRTGQHTASNQRKVARKTSHTRPRVDPALQVKYDPSRIAVHETTLTDKQASPQPGTKLRKNTMPLTTQKPNPASGETTLILNSQQREVASGQDGDAEYAGSFTQKTPVRRTVELLFQQQEQQADSLQMGDSKDESSKFEAIMGAQAIHLNNSVRKADAAQPHKTEEEGEEMRTVRLSTESLLLIDPKQTAPSDGNHHPAFPVASIASKKDGTVSLNTAMRFTGTRLGKLSSGASTHTYSGSANSTLPSKATVRHKRAKTTMMMFDHQGVKSLTLTKRVKRQSSKQGHRPKSQLSSTMSNPQGYAGHHANFTRASNCPTNQQLQVYLNQSLLLHQINTQIPLLKNGQNNRVGGIASHSRTAAMTQGVGSQRERALNQSLWAQALKQQRLSQQRGAGSSSPGYASLVVTTTPVSKNTNMIRSRKTNNLSSYAHPMNTQYQQESVTEQIQL